MIPAAFDYQAPTSLDDALRLLAEGGDDAKIIAGGQSLLPVLKLRLAAPDCSSTWPRSISSRGSGTTANAIVIGAMTPHYQVVARPARGRARIVARQVRRDRGGPASPASGHPRWGLRPRGPGERRPCADGGSGRRVPDRRSRWATSSRRRRLFPRSLHDRAWRRRDPVEVRVPKYTGWGSAYEKFVRVAQQWAIAGVAATVRTEGGTIAEARLALTNMGPTPVRAERPSKRWPASRWSPMPSRVR